MDNDNNKFVNVLKVRSFLWRISLFMEMRVQLGKIRVLLHNQIPVCAMTNLILKLSLGAKKVSETQEGNLLSDTCK